VAGVVKVGEVGIGETSVTWGASDIETDTDTGLGLTSTTVTFTGHSVGNSIELDCIFGCWVMSVAVMTAASPNTARAGASDRK